MPRPDATVDVSPHALEAIHQHALETYPHECCGALLGDADAARIVSALPLPNTTEEGPRRRFLIRPADYRAAEQQAGGAGLSLIGFYHSHPDHPARPSQHDLDHAWPNFHYVIASVLDRRVDDVRTWHLRDDRSAFDERRLVVSTDAADAART